MANARGIVKKIFFDASQVSINVLWVNWVQIMYKAQTRAAAATLGFCSEPTITFHGAAKQQAGRLVVITKAKQISHQKLHS
jgi:hypothetical protein